MVIAARRIANVGRELSRSTREGCSFLQLDSFTAEIAGNGRRNRRGTQHHFEIRFTESLSAELIHSRPAKHRGEDEGSAPSTSFRILLGTVRNKRVLTRHPADK